CCLQPQPDRHTESVGRRITRTSTMNTPSHPETGPCLAPGLHRRPRARWRGWLALTLGLLVGAGAAAVAWSLLPAPKHSVRTVMLVRQGRKWLLPPREPVVDLASHQRNQVAMIKSRLVLNSALRDPSLAGLPSVTSKPDPVEWLEKELQADFSIAPEMMR